ncbi:MAG: GNAT family N-acetyltransferase [Geminicoccaceae bacterium]
MTLPQLKLQTFATFENAETLWRDLEESGDAYVYQTYDWQSTWYEFVGVNGGLRPCLIAVMDADGRPLMFLPLAIERYGLWGVLTWLGTRFSDYNAPVLAPDAADRLERYGGIGNLWQTLQRKLPRFDYADFQRQPAHIGNQLNPFVQPASIEGGHAAHSTRLSGDWSSYYAKKRSKKTRHNEQRKRRNLARLGQLEFLIARTPADIDLMLPTMLRQKRAYVKALRKENIFDEPGYDEFLRARAVEGLTTGGTMLCGLKLDDDILAVQWAAVYKQRLYSIIASYDDGERNKLSPGGLLLHELFAWCFDHGIEVLDFTYGDEPYKLAWCEQTLALSRSLMPASAWGNVGVCALEAGIKAKRQLKDTGCIQQIRAAQDYLRNKGAVLARSFS